jgi:predicted nucleotidyltransferase
MKHFLPAQLAMSIKISDILKALNDAAIRYVIVGGIAVNLHGHARFTKDLDLIFAFDEDNLMRAMRILASIHFSPLLPVDMLNFANPELRSQWINEKGMVVFQLIDRAQIDRQIDVFVDTPIPFETLYATRENVALGGTNAPIVSIKHLIEMKTIAGRPQDIADIQKLRVIQMLQSREKQGN